MISQKRKKKMTRHKMVKQSPLKLRKSLLKMTICLMKNTTRMKVRDVQTCEELVGVKCLSSKF